MQLNELCAISPIDGRYRNKTFSLSNCFSEFALIRYRVLVEVEYFIALCELPLPQLKNFPASAFPTLRKVYSEFTIADAEKIKATERITNHDVKAVEYFLKSFFETQGWNQYSEFIHFGLTSQDINNTATPLLLKDAMQQVMLPKLNEVIANLVAKSEEWKNIPMLARTHGQPASPTVLGKEFFVFAERIQMQLQLLNQIPYSAKFGGATGNMNAHWVAYPTTDWKTFANHFVNDVLKLNRSQTTTQIEHYDNLAAMCDALKRINNILIDLCKDVWQYISMEYFKQQIKAGEIGSSAMPHKVNPIDFENAEGNFGMANAVFEHLAAKLPISRLQRDLTDSTVLRNLGVPLAHTLIGFESLMKGLNKIILNEAALHADLENNWAVVAEAIQTILRREGIDKPYEQLKALTRTNTKIGESEIHAFIKTLPVSDVVKKELMQITPFNYTGKFTFE